MEPRTPDGPHARWRSPSRRRPAAAVTTTAVAAAAAPVTAPASSARPGATRRTRWSRPTPTRCRAARSSTWSSAGSKRYDPKTGKAKNMIAEKIETTDSQNFTVTIKNGWTFSNGEKVTAKSFVDAWNYGASLKNNQKNAYFFGYIDGYDKVHPEDGGKPTADTLSGLKVDRHRHLHRQAQPEVLDLARHPRLRGLLAAAQGLLQRPRGLAEQARRQRPVHDRLVHQGLADVPAQVGRLLRPGQGAERRRRPQGLHRQQHRLHRPDGRQPRPRRRRARRPAQERQERPRRPVHQHTRRHHPDPRLPVLRQGLGQARAGEGPHRALPMAINREQITDRSSRRPAPPPPTGPHPVLGEEGGFKEGLCGDACEYDPKRGQEADRGGRRHPRRPGQDLVQRGHRLAQGVGRRGLQQHQQRARATTRPASATPSAPSPTSATRSPRRR